MNTPSPAFDAPAWPRPPAAASVAAPPLGLWMASVAARAQRGARRLLGLPADGWDLWHQASGGDPRAAEALVRQLAPAALALARQMLGRPEDAEDVVQEAFLRLWSAQVDDTRGAQLATYFHTIVLNRCRSQLVRQRELSTDPEALTQLQDALQAPAPEAPADGPALQQALLRLPARQRMALALWAYGDADADGIARAFGIDTNAAHQLLHRAKRSLRGVWQETRS